MKKMDKKVFSYIFGTALFLFLIVCLLVLFAEPVNHVPHFTISYQNISVDQARNITSQNLTVVDCRGLEGCGQCQFNQGHLPNATMINDPTTLYNTTNDILVYSMDGHKGSWFCEQLIGHVYGNVYNLDGGWNAYIGGLRAWS